MYLFFNEKNKKSKLYNFNVTMLILCNGVTLNVMSINRQVRVAYMATVLPWATRPLTVGWRWLTGYLCPRCSRRWAALRRCSDGSSSGGRRGRRWCSPPPPTGGSSQTDALRWWDGGKLWLIFGLLGQCYIGCMHILRYTYCDVLWVTQWCYLWKDVLFPNPWWTC